MKLFNRKKTCIVYGNCVAGFLGVILEQYPEFCQMYDVHYIRNFNLPTEGSPIIEPELLKHCDLFLYQVGHLQYPEFYDELPGACLKISFPVIWIYFLWPLYRVDPRNKPEPENGFPFGRYPYGDYLIMKLLREGLTAQQIFEKYMETDLNQMLNLDRILAENFQSGRELDAKCDLKIFSYIEAKFTEARLLWTPNHPDSPLIFMQINSILNAVGMSELSRETCIDLNSRAMLDHIHHPINPQIIRHFKLQWANEDLKYKYFDIGSFTFEEYLKRYIEFK